MQWRWKVPGRRNNCCFISWYLCLIISTTDFILFKAQGKSSNKPLASSHLTLTSSIFRVLGWSLFWGPACKPHIYRIRRVFPQPVSPITITGMLHLLIYVSIILDVELCVWKHNKCINPVNQTGQQNTTVLTAEKIENRKKDLPKSHVNG